LQGARQRYFIAPEVFEAAVREAKPLGLASVKWTGGEPTIHPEFPRLLRLQKKHGLRGSVETNGLEMTGRLARTMSRNGVWHVAVSLDGAVPRTHDSIRGVKGAHRRALKGIANLTAAGYRPQIIMTLMRKNAGELEDMLALAEGVGASSVKFNIVQPTLRGDNLHATGEALTVGELLEINKRLARELRGRHRIKIFMDVPMAFRSLKTILDGDGCCVCGILTILGLLADGSYALCGIGESVPDLVFGRAGENSLKDLWEGNPVLKRLRDGIPNKLKGVCGRCLMKGACLGSCVAQGYYRSRDILSAFWFCEQAEAQGLFPQTRLQPRS
jgi:SynChlorMet cassette radical SAM/SPASM protein ScmF